MKTNYILAVLFSILFFVNGFMICIYGNSVGHNDIILLGIFMIAAVFVGWWTWIIVTFRQLLISYHQTLITVNDVKKDIFDIKTIVREEFIQPKR
jgi:hypothetical protein